MKKANTEVYLDKRPNRDGLHSVKIRIYHNRKYRYYSTGIDLKNEDELEHALNGKRRTKKEKQIETKLTHLKAKAQGVINNLPVFTFDAFEDVYFENKNVSNTIFFAFDQYIKELKADDRVGTASSYLCARNSLQSFKKDLTFADITPKFLRKYEKWMLDNSKSKTTVGIYLRGLRTIYNQQNIDKSVYPFGDGTNKYSIPTGQNIKKALTVEEIAKIFHYQVKPGTNKEMARDYWMFLYLCNGMNVKDFCLLKWKNIDAEILTYKRAKTERSNKKQKQIQVAIKPQALNIINKWGVRSLSKEDYIFPHLKQGMNAEEQRKTFKQLTQVINRYVGQIAKETGIEKRVTTYYARHSFATVLKRSGTNVSMISELLGHSSLKVTENYLDSFEKEQLQIQTDALTVGL